MDFHFLYRLSAARRGGSLTERRTCASYREDKRTSSSQHAEGHTRIFSLIPRSEAEDNLHAGRQVRVFLFAFDCIQ